MTLCIDVVGYHVYGGPRSIFLQLGHYIYLHRNKKSLVLRSLLLISKI
jgi:hypothetical protein